jgi:hypothetical protein
MRLRLGFHWRRLLSAYVGFSKRTLSPLASCFSRLNAGMCPKGDDPRSLYQQNRAVRFTVSSTNPSGVLSGYVQLNFNGKLQSGVFSDLEERH